jgi:hypothetical protein
MKTIILAVLPLLLSTNVFANNNQCKVNDMNGSWVSYQGAVLGNPHTGVCKFTVANGLAQGTCDFSLGFKGPFTGEVVVSRDCSAKFSMDFSPAAPFVSDFQVQLHKDKQSFVGRWENNFGVIGVTNAVKR